MNVLIFMIVFCLMLFVATLFTVGVYITTRGSWYIQPDGKWKKYGMIFKEWSLFWEQYRKEKRIYYSPEELNKKWEFLKKVRPDLHVKYCISPWNGEETWIKPGLGKDIIEEDLHAIKDALACEIELVVE